MKSIIFATSMQRRKKYIIFRGLSFLLALHFFNISVDPLDPTPLIGSDIATVNEVESVAEIVLEKALHLVKSFPENKHDPNNRGSLLTADLTLVFYFQPVALSNPDPDRGLSYIKRNENCCGQYKNDILTPPPKS